MRAASSTQATSAVSSARSMPAKNEPKPIAASSASPIAVRPVRRAASSSLGAERGGEHDAARREHDARELQRAGPLARREADQHRDDDAGRRDRRDDAHRPDRRARGRTRRARAARARRRPPPTPSPPRRAPSARRRAPRRRGSAARGPATAPARRAARGAGSGSRRGSPTAPTRPRTRERVERPAPPRHLKGRSPVKTGHGCPACQSERGPDDPRSTSVREDPG